MRKPMFAVDKYIAAVAVAADSNMAPSVAVGCTASAEIASVGHRVHRRRLCRKAAATVPATGVHWIRHSAVEVSGVHWAGTACGTVHPADGTPLTLRSSERSEALPGLPVRKEKNGWNSN